MDPTQLQDDKSNDIHSLEHDDGSGGGADVTDATGGQKAAAPAAPKKSGIKKLWDKFNIYLVLFVLIVIIAIAVVVFITVKSRQTAEQPTASTGLSQDALKDLASTDVTVGNPKQILTINANSVFAGAVLIRSNLEVAGTLKIGGSLTLGDLIVSGTTKLGNTDVKDLNISGTLGLQGILTLKNGLNVTGRSTFSGEIITNSLATGALALNGDLNLTQHVIAGGTIPAIERGGAVGGGGTVSLSGSDTSGSIAVNTGTSPPAGCFATVTFSRRYNNIPHVVVSPVGSSAGAVEYYITRSTTGFVLCTTNSAPSGQSFGFDYIVMG
jgi:cytoskeletal protein CcmA (bactofilin family)